MADVLHPETRKFSSTPVSASLKEQCFEQC